MQLFLPAERKRRRARGRTTAEPLVQQRSAATVCAGAEKTVAGIGIRMRQAAKSRTLRALQYRNFQLFFAGQLISLIGTWMQSVAQSWLVYRMTGSPALLGLATFAGQIPIFILSPVAGYAADRLNRRKVVIATQSASMVLALMLAALTLMNRVQIWQIFVLASLLGVVNAFDIPARQSFLVEMVGRGDLMNAIALNSSMFNGARIVGPAIAGILVAKIGEGWCFFANGISYVAVIWGLLLMKVKAHRPAPASMSAWETIREGFHYVGRTIPIRAIVQLIAIVSFAGMPFTVLMPIFADRILHAGAQGLGILMGTTGAGALVAALLLASRTGLKGFTRWIPSAAAGFAVSLAIFAVSRQMWLSCLMLFLAGFAVMLQVGASNTLIQSMVPDHLRGRAMSVYSMMYIGVGPIGAAAAGFAADAFGAPITLVAGAVICLAASGVFAAELPAIRRVARDLIRKQETMGEIPVTEILDPAPAP
ncbi:MAG TPA: MFS transporter [Bryobacteraceae bacterium]|nr:MFS transporter [Bryobacteraceae bacterium]